MNKNVKNGVFRKWLGTIKYIIVVSIMIPTLVFVIKGVFRIGQCPHIIAGGACEPEFTVLYAIQGIIYLGPLIFLTLALLSLIICLSR